MFPTPLARMSAGARTSYRAALAVALILWVLPLVAVLLTSAKPIEDLLRGNFWGWPSDVRLIENYRSVLVDSRMAQFILNSFLIAVPAVAGAVGLSSMAGFALAKYRFRGNLLIFVLFVAGNLVPFQILMIPVRHLTIDVLGLHDSRWSLILFHMAFQTGFCTLFMRNFIHQLPDALIETARLDGMGELRIFCQVILPLIRPAMAAVAALTFTFVWNDYFWSLALVQADAVRPVTAGLQTLRGMWLSSWQLVSAASIVAAIPPVLVFFVMQRHFIAGLTLGVGEPD